MKDKDHNGESKTRPSLDSTSPVVTIFPFVRVNIRLT
jgi:hypothetical protein